MSCVCRSHIRLAVGGETCLSQSKLLAVGLLSNPGHLRHISRSQQWGLEASRSEGSGRTLCLAYTVLSFSVGAVKRSLSFSIGGGVASTS